MQCNFLIVSGMRGKWFRIDSIKYMKGSAKLGWQSTRHRSSFLARGLRVRKLPGGSKLDGLWFGPCEVMSVLSESRIEVDTGPARLQILPSTRLKPYIPPSGGQEVPCHYYEPHSRGPPQEEEYVVEEMVEVRKKGPPHEWRRKARFRGYPDPEWHDISGFVHHINDVWHKFNETRGIELSIADIMPAQK